MLWPFLQASSAYKHSLKEVLALPAIASKIKDTKAAREVSALQEFYTMLTADSSRAFYGPGHVLAAAELGAIQTLLISGACEAATLGQSIIECTVRRDPKMPSRAGASPGTQCSLQTSDAA
jgi:peptide subunit release factor 1 (eRF1)